MAEDKTTPQNKQRVEQNDPKGAILKSVKPDLMSGNAHRISIFQPTVIIDSHMHIQSGRCSTVQFTRNQGPLAPIQKNIEFSRGLMESAGGFAGYLLTLFEWIALKPIDKVEDILGDTDKPTKNPRDGYFDKNALLEFITMQANPTDVIAKLFIKERENVVEKYFKNAGNCPLYEHAPYLFFSSVVMTMDMEYAHVDGYFGLRIYNPLFDKNKAIDITDPSRYWTPEHGKWVKTPILGGMSELDIYVKSQYKSVYQKTGEPAQVEIIDSSELFNDYEQYKEKVGYIIGGSCDPQSGENKSVRIEALPVLMPESEGKKYENWEKQVKLTEESVLKYPLKFLPMFHYDPRRWQLKGKNANADLITKVLGENALYLGFKMYTAQGYRPWDVRRLPTLKEFYGKCCLNGIPIMNHCTPGGARSHEADEYYYLEHPFDDLNEEKNEREKCDPSEYFSKYFVSPEAWKNVLDSSVELEGEQGRVHLNALRLCLAHFGGPAKPGPEWNQQIIDMITRDDNKYPNLYTDISSSFADDGFREDFKTLFTGKLDETQKKKLRSRILFGTDWFMTFGYGLFNKKNLWDYCATTKEWLDSFDTSLWPYFSQYNPYRFYWLDTEVPRIARSIISMRNKGVYESLKKLEPEEIEKIHKEAAWIKVANKGQENYEETP